MPLSQSSLSPTLNDTSYQNNDQYEQKACDSDEHPGNSTRPSVVS